MTSSLVGSEMCIRDRQGTVLESHLRIELMEAIPKHIQVQCKRYGVFDSCLLYTSDAADDM
eukprot:3036798-Prorocentrum_lima.AAC.1